MTDPISDMLNRIKNAQQVHKDLTTTPFSKVKFNIAELLKKNGFVADAKSKGRGIKKIIIVYLKYNNDDSLIMNGFKRVSKPGQRIYYPAKDIKRIKSGFGISIISTSKGIMTGQEARKNKLGGEIMLEVW